jgi:hypothetical protein
MSEDTNHPDKTYRMPRGISTAIWSKEVEEHGTTRTKQSVKLQKSIRDEANGSWKNQDIFLFPSEIPAVITVLRKAYEHCCLREQFEEPAPI